MRPCHFPAIGSFNMNQLGISDDETSEVSRKYAVRLVVSEDISGFLGVRRFPEMSRRVVSRLFRFCFLVCHAVSSHVDCPSRFAEFSK